jgi:hypothetical protein
MHDRPTPGTPGKKHTRSPARSLASGARHLARWVGTRRRAALALMLRGACYGTGTTAAGLIGFWLQHRL